MNGIVSWPMVFVFFFSYYILLSTRLCLPPLTHFIPICCKFLVTFLLSCWGFLTAPFQRFFAGCHSNNFPSAAFFCWFSQWWVCRFGKWEHFWDSWLALASLNRTDQSQSQTRDWNWSNGSCSWIGPGLFITGLVIGLPSLTAPDLAGSNCRFWTWMARLKKILVDLVPFKIFTIETK